MLIDIRILPEDRQYEIQFCPACMQARLWLYYLCDDHGGLASPPF